ncbi:hypothetical protein, partial [Rhodovulum euryhalinum]
AETLQGLVTRFRLRQARTTAPMAALRLVGPEAGPPRPRQPEAEPAVPARKKTAVNDNAQWQDF